MSEIMVASMLEPDTVHALLTKTTAFLINYVLAFKEAGADGIIMAEPAAGLLSPAQCQEFSSDYVKTLSMPYRMIVLSLFSITAEIRKTWYNQCFLQEVQDYTSAMQLI